MDELLKAAQAQDEALRRAGVDLWIGAEPTFTDRTSQDPWWLWQAEGGDKEPRAVAFLRAFAARIARRVEICRALGRHYPGEERPRFCFGARWARAEESPPQGAGASAGGEHDLLLDTAVPPPVVGPEEAWATATPDPAVIELNLAPAPDLFTFVAYAGAAHAAAAEVGLSALRWRYNGQTTDSGGGGQITFGGPAPERSPFFATPRLLPRLIRYLSNHPALSFTFAPECAGSAGQGPRPDEGVRERFEELAVALDRLEALGDRATPEEIWGALAPLLVDASGNAHRAELNVEKLWNPYFGPRGKLGLVELRALRMQPDAGRMVAVAALFRAVAARCARAPGSLA